MGQPAWSVGVDGDTAGDSAEAGAAGSIGVGRTARARAAGVPAWPKVMIRWALLCENHSARAHV
jgi:hypothetical protein